MTRLNVVVDDDLYRRFKVSAAAHDVSLSDVVRRALVEFLKADEIIQGIETLPDPKLVLPQSASELARLQSKSAKAKDKKRKHRHH